MLLSRGRLLLRAVLLSVGGGFMLWRALEARAAGAGLGGPSRVLGERLALVQALVGLLALLTALATLLSLRERRRRHTLRLGAPAEGGGPDGPPTPRPPSGTP